MSGPTRVISGLLLLQEARGTYVLQFAIAIAVRVLYSLRGVQKDTRAAVMLEQAK